MGLFKPTGIKFLIFLVLCGCVSPCPPIIKEDRRMADMSGDGYTYETWERPDGTHYMKFHGRIMDLEEPKK